MLRIYTDGSCKKNPGGPGGFGVVVVNEDSKIILAHSARSVNTTNNREEMKAIIWAMEYAGKFPDATIYTDSSYCYNTFTNWMYTWKKNNWIKSDNKVPLNLNLIKEFYKLREKNPHVKIEKVAGHAGDPGNEYADKLATGAIATEDIIGKVL